MKNIIYKHLKTCVLSLCVAVSCGNKAFGGPGVYFRCTLCTTKEKSDVWIKEKEWVNHYIQKHSKKLPEGLAVSSQRPGAFLCEQCNVEFTHRREITDHMYKEHEKDKKYDFACLDCNQAFPWRFGDAHIALHVCYKGKKPKFYPHCKVCDEYMHANHWNRHVHKKHRSDFSKNIFVCLDCEKYRYQENGNEICCQECKYENCVQCRICAEEIEKKHIWNEKKDETPKKDSWSEGTDGLFKKENWNRHVHEKHEGDFYEKLWYCPGCKNLRYQEQKGILYCQNCQYVYCQSHKGVVKKENWNEHVHEKHKGDFCEKLWYCPGCQKLRYQEQKGIVWCQHCQHVVYCSSHKGVFEKENWHEHLRQCHKEDKDSFWICPKCGILACGEFCTECASKNTWSHLLCQYCKKLVECGEPALENCKECDSVRKSAKQKSIPWFCQICKEFVEDLIEHREESHPDEWLCLGCKSALAQKEGNYCKKCKDQIWCQLCKEAIEWNQWNAHRREKHINDNLKSVFVCCGNIYPAECGKSCAKCKFMYCQPCKQRFARKLWNEHVKQAHKGDFSSTVYVCPVCLHSMKLQGREGHMIEEHSDIYCRLCHEVVGKNKEEKMEHYNVKHKNDVHECSFCGAIFLNVEGFGSLKGHYLRKHTLHCDICGEDFGIENGFKHMKEVHFCKESCQLCLDNSTGSVVWRHGLLCENTFQCPFSDCNFADVVTQFQGKHLVQVHECDEKCSLLINKNKVEIKHADTCGNAMGTCPMCGHAILNKDLIGHCMYKHGCVERCPVSAWGAWHDLGCKEGGYYCTLCKLKGKQNLEHLKTHMQEKGCTGGCRIIQDQDEGMVFIKHDEEHKNGGIEPCGCCGEEQIEEEQQDKNEIQDEEGDGDEDGQYDEDEYGDGYDEEQNEGEQNG